MSINKVIYGGETLIDLTSDTVVASALLKNYTAHGKDGAVVVGTCEYDVNSQDATVAVAEMLSGKTAYARGAMLTGTMPNNGAVVGVIDSVAAYTIPQGYHDGSGTVSLSAEDRSKLIAGNIKQGVTILQIKGTYAGDSVEKPQSKTVTPSKVQQAIVPDQGFTCLSQVTVNAIPYVEAQNAAGGTTVTIG